MDDDKRQDSDRAQGLVGQESIVHFLKHSVKNGKTVHAYCFFGPKGIGKKRVIDFFIRTLLCERNDGTACGLCRNCALFAQNNHTDVYKIEKDPDEKNIGIEAAREMRERMYLTPSISRRNIAVIYDAHTLSTEAQNSILKVLEEPPESAVIILSADFWDSLLPTLRSRLLGLKLNTVSTGQIEEFLRKNHPETAREYIFRAARLSFGKIETAGELINDKVLLESTEKEFEKAVQFLNSRRGERLKMLYDVFGKSMSFVDQQNKGLKFANQLLIAAEWAVHEKFSIKETFLPAGFNGELLNNLTKISNGLFKAIELLKRNVAPRLVFEQFIWNAN